MSRSPLGWPINIRQRHLPTDLLSTAAEVRRCRCGFPGRNDVEMDLGKLEMSC